MSLILLGFENQRKQAKPKHISTFQSFAYVVFANISLTKASHLTRSNINGVRVSTLSKKIPGKMWLFAENCIINNHCPPVSMERCLLHGFACKWFVGSALGRAEWGGMRDWAEGEETLWPSSFSHLSCLPLAVGVFHFRQDRGSSPHALLTQEGLFSQEKSWKAHEEDSFCSPNALFWSKPVKPALWTVLFKHLIHIQTVLLPWSLKKAKIVYGNLKHH